MLSVYFKRYMMNRKLKSILMEISKGTDFSLINKKICDLVMSLNRSDFLFYTPKLGVSVTLESSYNNIEKLLLDLNLIIDIVQNGKYIDNDICADNPKKLNLDDFLTSREGYPISLENAVNDLIEKIILISKALSIVDDNFKNYYNRKFSKLFLEIFRFIQTLAYLEMKN